MDATVLVIDDEKNIRRTLRMVLEGAGLSIVEAGTAEDGLKHVESNDVDLVILDVKLPGMSGIEALGQLRKQPATQRLPVLMISGHASVAEAVEAVQLGATDFFEKPLDRDRVLVSVRNALKTWQLEREVERLRASSEQRHEMIGQSVVMRQLYSEIEKVAPTKGRVLVTGESGTGKELIARAIHQLSPRHERSFIKVNCAAIPAELIESELFGYERGAFTGAQGKRKGVFEMAHEGTLFLDEIGDMSMSAQAKVLRALQSGEITRVGGEQIISVDVRVIAATNKDLESAIEAGSFRDDLYFRLNVVPLRSPALRERKEDIPALLRAFLIEFCRENGFREKPIDDEVYGELSQRSWPGNVRELRNVVERMVILSGDRITVRDIPPEAGVVGGSRESAPESSASAHSLANVEHRPHVTLSLREYREKAERDYILAALEECDWNISKTAALLGTERTNLHKKMRAHGIKRDHLV